MDARVIAEADLVDFWQMVGHSLAVTAVEDSVGRDDRDAGQSGQTGEQIEIRGEQPGYVGDVVGYRHDHLGHRIDGRRVKQPLSEPMLVPRTGGGDATVVRVERGDQEVRLPKETTCASVDLHARLEIVDDQPREVVDRTPVSAKVVIEREE